MRHGNSDYWEKRIKGKYPIGSVYGRLTVIGYRHSSEYEGTWYLVCKCSCGKEKEIRRGDHLIKGFIKSCGCLWKELMPQLGSRSAKKSMLPPGEATLRFLWRAYRHQARKRKLEVSLTETEFRKLIFLPCHYCRRLPFNVVRFKNRGVPIICGGIDRINSSLGYTKSNSVPCCKVCNRSKSDMSQDEFFTWLKYVTSSLFGVTY